VTSRPSCRRPSRRAVTRARCRRRNRPQRRPASPRRRRRRRFQRADPRNGYRNTPPPASVGICAGFILRSVLRGPGPRSPAPGSPGGRGPRIQQSPSGIRRRRSRLPCARWRDTQHAAPALSFRPGLHGGWGFTCGGSAREARRTAVFAAGRVGRHRSSPDSAPLRRHRNDGAEGRDRSSVHQHNFLLGPVIAGDGASVIVLCIGYSGGARTAPEPSRRAGEGTTGRHKPAARQSTRGRHARTPRQDARERQNRPATYQGGPGPANHPQEGRARPEGGEPRLYRKLPLQWWCPLLKILWNLTLRRYTKSTRKRDSDKVT